MNSLNLLLVVDGVQRGVITITQTPIGLTLHGDIPGVQLYPVETEGGKEGEDIATKIMEKLTEHLGPPQTLANPPQQMAVPDGYMRRLLEENRENKEDEDDS